MTSFSVQTNPLSVDLILHNLFTFADYKTLKNYRIVCRKWTQIGNPIFLKRSILNCTEGGIPISGHLEELKSLFSSLTFNGRICFDAFKYNIRLLTPQFSKMYFEPYKMSMKQLEVVNRNRLDEYNHDDDVYTGPFIRDTIFYSRAINKDELIGPKLRKLKLTNENYKKEYLAVSLEKLSLMTEIDLSDCAISVPVEPEDRVKLKPKVLKLRDVRLQIGNGGLALARINEILDFAVLETLSLHYYEEDLALNLKDCANIKNLSLSRVTIHLDRDNGNNGIACEQLNLEYNRHFLNGEELQEFKLDDYLRPGKSNVTIDSGPEVYLDFSCNSIEKLTTIGLIRLNLDNIYQSGLKELDICPSPLYAPVQLNLALLPPTIEVLRIKTSNCNISCSQPVSLPNLKHVHLKNGLGALPHLQNCPALVDLVLVACRPTETVFQVQLVPPSVKKLALQNFEGFRISGKRNSKLEVLILSNEHDYVANDLWQTTLQFANKLHADLLVLFHRNEQYSSSAILFNEEQVLLGKRISERMKIGKISVGPVLWESDREEIHGNGPVPEHVVGSEAKYLLLENQGRKNISEEEFMGVLPFREQDIMDWDLYLSFRDA